MTTRGQINSNFYQIVDVDANGNPTSVKNAYLANANVNHANTATTAGTVTTQAQPNITSLGTLTTLTSTGNITAPYFIGNVVGNISGNLIVPGANTDVIYNNEGSAGASDNFTFNAVSNVLTVTGSIVGTNFTGDGGNLSNIQVGNVSGLGNIATVNLDGNVSNVLSGTGTWIALGDTANANYANFAGNVVNAAQPNITSLGNLTSLQLNNTVTPITANVGQMFWDTNEHTVTIGMENGIQQQVGLEQYVYVKASSAITDGQVVMFTGASGNNVEAAPADVTSVGFKTDYIIGVATQNIALNGFGYITVFGQVHGLNTNSFNVGDILWLSTSTPGLLVNTQPTDPNYQIQIAAVTKKSAGDGHIQVRVNPYWALNKLTDVTITTPTTGQALVYNGSNIWVNGNPQQANIANIANSVAVANVVGIGNIATVNLDGNVSNVLSGTGTWIAAGGGGTPGGSNTQVQFNDNGVFGGNASLTFDKTTGVLTSSRLVSTVATGTAPFTVTSTTEVANLNAYRAGYINVASTGSNFQLAFVGGTVNTGAGNIANLAYNTNIRANTTTGTVSANTFTSTVLTGTAPFTVTSTTQVANLNVAAAGTATTANTVIDAAQPNITSTGTLVSLNVTGNLAAGNISSTGLGNVANVVFTKYNESVVAGGSVTGTITPDVSTGTIFNYTLTGNITLNSLANAVAGSGCTLILTQGGAGSYTLTSSMKYLGGTKTLSTSVGAIDIISIFYDGTTYYASLGKGYA